MKYKIVILSILLLFVIKTNVKSQNFMEIKFNTEIIYNDTCIRFYNVLNFKQKEKNVWNNMLEDLINIGVKGNKNNAFFDEYYSMCDNIIFYCLDGYVDSSLLTIEGLENELLKKKVICKYYYNKPPPFFIIDPFNYGYYKSKKPFQ